MTSIPRKQSSPRHHSTGRPLYAGPYIRWLILRDYLEIVDIEQQSFAEPWDERRFSRELNRKNTLGIVAELPDESIAGFCIYDLRDHSLTVANFAVHPQHRREGVGRALIGYMIDKLAPSHRKRILVEANEDDLRSHLFLRACGFRALGVIRGETCLCGECDEIESDAILFQYRPPVAPLLNPPPIRRDWRDDPLAVGELEIDAQMHPAEAAMDSDDSDSADTEDRKGT